MKIYVSHYAGLEIFCCRGEMFDGLNFALLVPLYPMLDCANEARPVTGRDSLRIHTTQDVSRVCRDRCCLIVLRCFHTIPFDQCQQIDRIGWGTRSAQRWTVRRETPISSAKPICVRPSLRSAVLNSSGVMLAARHQGLRSYVGSNRCSCRRSPLQSRTFRSGWNVATRRNGNALYSAVR